MAKLADALDSGSSGATLGGSNPLERSEASERILSAGGENRLSQGWVCGGQFFRVSGHPFHPGMRFENGLGQVLGGQILSSPDRSAGQEQRSSAP